MSWSAICDVLNQVSQPLTTLSTIALAIATIFLLLTTRRYVDATEALAKAAESNRKSTEQIVQNAERQAKSAENLVQVTESYATALKDLAQSAGASARVSERMNLFRIVDEIWRTYHGRTTEEGQQYKNELMFAGREAGLISKNEDMRATVDEMHKRLLGNMLSEILAGDSPDKT